MTLEQLEDLSLEELRAEWARTCGAPIPNLSPDLLRLGIGYKLQEAKRGRVSRSTRSLLRQISERGAEGADRKPMPRKLTLGTKLVRDWHGVGHTVTVLDDGFAFDGKHWRSLTAIAKAISGSHCSGPVFFGLVSARK